MTKNKLLTPEGTKDYLFEEVSARRKVTDILTNLYTLNGYAEVETSGIEFLDVYTVGKGALPVEYMYKLTDSKGRILVVRPDSTSPIARLMATRLRQNPLPVRLFYTQPVHFVNPSMRGRRDEILQTGIELIAPASTKADIEALSLAITSLKSVSPTDFSIEIGHIGIFNTLIKSLNLSPEDQENIRLLIEAKNYSALNDLLDSFNMPELVAPLKKLPSLFGDEQVFERASSILTGEAIEILDYLKSIYTTIKSLGLCANIMVDLGIVTKNDYYTGIVFQGYIAGSGEAVLSGGRYDSLLGEYGRDCHAIGFAVNVDYVAKYYLNSYKKSSPTYLVFSDDHHLPEAIKYITNQTAKAVTAELSLCDTLEQTIQYARLNGINQIAVVTTDVHIIEVRAEVEIEHEG